MIIPVSIVPAIHVSMLIRISVQGPLVSWAPGVQRASRDALHRSRMGEDGVIAQMLAEPLELSGR